MKKIHWSIWAIILSVLIMGIVGYLLIDLVTPKVGLCLADVDSEIEEKLQSALKKAGYTVLVECGENNQDIQNRQVESLLKKGVKLLIVQPVDPENADAVLEMADQTPVLFMESAPESLGESHFVGWSQEKMGHMQASLLDKYLAKADVNGDRYVKYMLLSASEDGKYLKAVVESAGTYNAVKLEEAVCEGTAEEAKAILKKAFSKYGRDLELVFCDDSALALGAIAAVRENGRTPGRDVIVIGAGMASDCEEAVRTGAMIAALVEDKAVLCNQVIQVAKNLMAGRDAEKICYVDYKILTHENVAQ